jgi:hypothetical protein
MNIILPKEQFPSHFFNTNATTKRDRRIQARRMIRVAAILDLFPATFKPIYVGTITDNLGNEYIYYGDGQ